RSRHVPLVAAIGAGYGLGSLADGRTIAVHTRITATEHYNTFATHADQALGAAGEPQFVVDVGDEIGQCLVDARQVLAAATCLHVGVGYHSEEYGVVLIEQLLERHVAGAHVDAQAELNTHALHDLPALLDHFLLELERRDAECQQTSDSRVAVEYDRRDAVAH